MYLMQVDAFGPDDRRCAVTNDKIAMVQETGTIASPQSEDKDNLSVGGSDDEKEESKTKPLNPVMKMFKKISKKK